MIAKTRQSKSRSGKSKNPKKVNVWKYRSKNQISEDTSIRLFLNLLPVEWIWRLLAPDYGIDVELELVEPVTTVDIQGNIETLDPHEQIVTGTILWIQMKSVQKFETKKEEEVQFTLETPLLRYALSCQIPIILVVADLETRQLYWFHLQKYIRYASTNNNFKWWTNKTTVKIHISTDACIRDSSSPAFLEWRRIAMEPAMIREVANLQANLYRSREILSQLHTCSAPDIPSLLSSLTDHLSACWCSSLLFFDPDFRKGWAIRSDILDPVIERIERAAKDKTSEIDVNNIMTELERISQFGCEVAEVLSH